MTTITWIPMAVKTHSTIEKAVENIVYFPPEPAFKYLQEQRSKTVAFLKCPAFSSFLKNTFVIKNPYDLTINIDRGNDQVSITEYNQEFYENNIHCHESQDVNDALLLSLPPRYLFITDVGYPVEAKMFPMMLDPEASKNNFNIIPGGFDITKWIRPLEAGIEAVDDTKPIVLKRGAPIYMVQFVPADGSLVKLNMGIMNNEIANTMATFLTVKEVLPKQNLDTLYNMSAEYLAIAKKKIHNAS